MLTRNQLRGEIGRAVEQLVFVIADERDFVVLPQRAVQVARLGKVFQWIAASFKFISTVAKATFTSKCHPPVITSC